MMSLPPQADACGVSLLLTLLLNLLRLGRR